MTGLTAFGVGIAVGYLLSVLVAVILDARGVYPHDPRYDEPEE